MPMTYSSKASRKAPESAWVESSAWSKAATSARLNERQLAASAEFPGNDRYGRLAERQHFADSGPSTYVRLRPIADTSAAVTLT